MVQGACLYGDRCRFSHDSAVVEAQRRITPPSQKTRVKPMEPVHLTSVAPVHTPSTMPSISAQPFVASQRDPRLDPALVVAVTPTPQSTDFDPRPPSPQAPPLSSSIDISLLNTLTPTSSQRSSAADELKKLL